MIFKTPDKSFLKFLAFLPIFSVHFSGKFLKRQFSRGKLRKISEQFLRIFTEQLRCSVSKHTIFIAELAFTGFHYLNMRLGDFLCLPLTRFPRLQVENLLKQLLLFGTKFSLLKSIGQCVQL